jgi:DNA-binding response OmpR family regulator
VKKVLIVDDEVALTTLLKANLEAAGRFEVQTENRGAAAVRAAQRLKPDIVLLDIMMPDLEGTEVLNRLRQVASLREVPVIFLTATLMEGETAAGGENYSFLPKPIEADSLIAAIDDLIGQ